MRAFHLKLSGENGDFMIVVQFRAVVASSTAIEWFIIESVKNVSKDKFT